MRLKRPRRYGLACQDGFVGSAPEWGQGRHRQCPERIDSKYPQRAWRAILVRSNWIDRVVGQSLPRIRRKKRNVRTHFPSVAHAALEPRSMASSSF